MPIEVFERISANVKFRGIMPTPLFAIRQWFWSP